MSSCIIAMESELICCSHVFIETAQSEGTNEEDACTSGLARRERESDPNQHWF